MLLSNETVEILGKTYTLLIVGLGKHCSPDETCNGFIANKIYVHRLESVLSNKDTYLYTFKALTIIVN